MPNQHYGSVPLLRSILREVGINIDVPVASGALGIVDIISGSLHKRNPPD